MAAPLSPALGSPGPALRPLGGSAGEGPSLLELAPHAPHSPTARIAIQILRNPASWACDAFHSTFHTPLWKSRALVSLVLAEIPPTELTDYLERLFAPGKAEEFPVLGVDAALRECLSRYNIPAAACLLTRARSRLSTDAIDLSFIKILPPILNSNLQNPELAKAVPLFHLFLAHALPKLSMTCAKMVAHALSASADTRLFFERFFSAWHEENLPCPLGPDARRAALVRAIYAASFQFAERLASALPLSLKDRNACAGALLISFDERFFFFLAAQRPSERAEPWLSPAVSLSLLYALIRKQELLSLRRLLEEGRFCLSDLEEAAGLPAITPPIHQLLIEAHHRLVSCRL
jgi:hypothetical protein